MDVGLSVIFQNIDRARSDFEVYQNELRLAVLCEPLGFDSIWTVEHHFTNYTMMPDPTQFLTYMAGKTEKAKLGTMVMVLPWHKPIRAAEEISMLDNISNGRMILGIGRGIGKIEYDGLGIDMNLSREIFIESGEAVLAALRNGYMEYNGKHIQQAKRDIRPEPLRNFDGRTFVAAISPETAHIAAELGAGIMVIPQKSWNEHGQDLLDYQARWRTLYDTEPPRPIAVCWTVCHEDEERARELADEYLVNYYKEVVLHYQFGGSHFANTKGHEQYAKWADGFNQAGQEKVADFFKSLQVWGTPDQCFEQIMEIRRKFGMNHFVGVFSYGKMPYDEAERGMRLFANQVAPKLREVPDIDLDDIQPLSAAS